MPHRVLIIDDDPEILELISTDLKLSGFYTETASDGLCGLQKSQTGNYDLIILDVMMPKMDGFEVCKNLRLSAKTRDIPTILLTAKGTLEDKVTGFGSGADDYLVKPFDIQELLVRMRALLRRTTSKESCKVETLESGDLKLYPDSLEVNINDKLVKLTPTEFEILYCLMQHINQAVSLTVLLNEVWGYDSDEDVRMVRVHIGGLRNKIEPNSKYPKYLHTVTNVGYRLVPWGEE
ncbi:MAG TPA: response regulator transcription factor [Candidatus Gastranaerophilales bacterium]|nr:response regulator transcription factor [Candidatus Gastranaerophilales bacterium]